MQEQELLASATRISQRIWLTFPHGTLPDIANLAVLGEGGSGLEIYVWECYLNSRIVAMRNRRSDGARTGMPTFQTGECGKRLALERDLYDDAIELRPLSSRTWDEP